MGNNWQVDTFIVGSASSSTTLTDEDGLYPSHTNELRQRSDDMKSMLDNYIYVDQYAGDDLGAKINAARADNSDSFSNSIVVLPSGAQTLTTSANFTDSVHFTVAGLGTTINMAVVGGVGLDFAGSNGYKIEIAEISGDYDDITAVAIFCASSSTGTNGDLGVINVTNCHGKFSSALVYHIGGEELRIINTQLVNESVIGYSYAQTADNVDSISSAYVTEVARSVSQARIINSFIASNGFAETALIYTDRGQLYFDNVEFRSEGETIIKVNCSANGVENLHFHSIRMRMASSLTNDACNFIEADDDSNGYSLRYVLIDGESFIQTQRTLTTGCLIKTLGTCGVYGISIENRGGVIQAGGGLTVAGDAEFVYLDTITAIGVTVAGNLATCYYNNGYQNPLLATALLTVSGTTSNLTLGYPGGYSANMLGLIEKNSDPTDPPEGQSVMWQSDGTGAGDDGDIMIKITAGAVTKTATIVDFSGA